METQTPLGGTHTDSERTWIHNPSIKAAGTFSAKRIRLAGKWALLLGTLVLCVSLLLDVYGESKWSGYPYDFDEHQDADRIARASGDLWDAGIILMLFGFAMIALFLSAKRKDS